MGPEVEGVGPEVDGPEKGKVWLGGPVECEVEGVWLVEGVGLEEDLGAVILQVSLKNKNNKSISFLSL